LKWHPEWRGFFVRDVVRQGQELGCRDSHVFGMNRRRARIPSGQYSRKGFTAGPARMAVAAHGVHVHDHPVSRPGCLHGLPDFDDLSYHLVSRDVGSLRWGIRPSLNLRSAAQRQLALTLTRASSSAIPGTADLFEGKVLIELLDQHGFHKTILSNLKIFSFCRNGNNNPLG